MDNKFMTDLTSMIVFFLKILQLGLYFLVIYWIYKMYGYLKELIKSVTDIRKQNERMFKLIVKNLELKQSIKEVDQE